ncbi:MAG: hypothetical protein HDT02_04530 [Bacteroidales bacterium]|nr:hypothetical protein [Bacteroidales bacterium]
MNKIVRHTYRVARSLLFSTVLVAVGLLVFLYIALSIPPVQNVIKEKATKELSNLLGVPVSIGKVSIVPFNEVMLSDVLILDPADAPCLSIGRLGAGISLWSLISDRKIEITYGELIELDARIYQSEKDGPLNIQFLIDALSSKDKNKPPTQFDLTLRNIVIRKSKASFDRRWKPYKNDGGFDPDHIAISDLKADVAMPVLKNNDFVIDIRRLSLRENSGFNLSSLTLLTGISDSELSVNKFEIRLPGSLIHIEDFKMNYDGLPHLINALEKGRHHLSITNSHINPQDLACFYSPLSHLSETLYLRGEAVGNINNLQDVKLNLSTGDNRFSFELSGSASSLKVQEETLLSVQDLNLKASDDWFRYVLNLIQIDSNAKAWIDPVGYVDMTLSGSVLPDKRQGDIEMNLLTQLGELSINAEASDWSKEGISGSAEILFDEFQLNKFPGLSELGQVSGKIKCEAAGQWASIGGEVDATLDYLDFRGTRIDSITAKMLKSGPDVTLAAGVRDEIANFAVGAEGSIEAGSFALTSDLRISRIIPARFGILGQYPGKSLSGNVTISISGPSLQEATGAVNIDNLLFADNSTSAESLKLNHLSVTLEDAYVGDIFGSADSVPCGSVGRVLNIDSDVLQGSVRGCFSPKNIKEYEKAAAEISLRLLPDDAIYSFFKLPVRPLRDVNIEGSFVGKTLAGNLSLEAPYILQGKNKLIRGTSLHASYDEVSGINAKVTTIVPAKNDDMTLDILASGKPEMLNATFGWRSNPAARANEGTVLDTQGALNLSVSQHDRLLSGNKVTEINIAHSVFTLGGKTWTIGESNIVMNDGRIEIAPLLIGNGLQSVSISGIAGKDPMDIVTANLTSVDLKYIFDLLNINYVTFGGLATGRAMASGLLGKDFSAKTEDLTVKNLSYNNAVLGDGKLLGRWDNVEKMVGIDADIRKDDKTGATVHGGVYVTRDSLSFDFDANKVNAALIQPFLKAFTSEVEGRASGKLKLYGSFKDVDLIGDVFADEVSMKVDFTNVTYTATDSVIMRPGIIRIPGLQAKDKYGNTGKISGYVKHHYFHDADFRFDVTDANGLLCFDTNEKINPVWYGKIFASGRASIIGHPGIVRLDGAMITDKNSEFTFVLEDSQTADDYAFLTFSDRSKAKEEISDSISSSDSLEEIFRNINNRTQAETESDLFLLDLNATVTPEAKVIIVMDPDAGDKITAEGKGGLRMTYSSASDELNIFGNYNIVNGFYNFSLQDIILRGFKIEPESSISFSGDPLAGVMDIKAAYRVNTSLSDLDKSFSSDPDLNRTSVPVDALLEVTGPLTSPEIGFDINLPTLSQEVVRKVRSIISSEDMLQRQVLYLLALNRFYTPEYAGSGSGGELASVASATLSSQLSNLVGQLTDKVYLNPSFKADKSDFSDMEVNLALSSRLLDNRLLINGNLGYRDRSTSQTMFVGDFDIEYLLNKDGKLRLKAYNHFNDANYYLRSALTTQGIGIVYRKDFNDMLAFLRRKKKKSPNSGKPEAALVDSVGNNPIDNENESKSDQK